MSGESLDIGANEINEPPFFAFSVPRRTLLHLKILIWLVNAPSFHVIHR